MGPPGRCRRVLDGRNDRSHRLPNYEPFIGLAAAAAVTERINLTTAIAILPFRENSALVAKQAATIHHLSGGRLGQPGGGGMPPGGPVRRSEKPIASSLTYFSLDDDPESQARATLGHYYSFMPQYADMVVAGTAKGGDDVRERVRAFAEQECDELILFPASSNPTRWTGWRRRCSSGPTGSVSPEERGPDAGRQRRREPE